MKLSRDWPPIERLPEAPGVVKLVGNGYWLDGRFYPSQRPVITQQPPHKGWLYRVMGR